MKNHCTEIAKTLYSFLQKYTVQLLQKFTVQLLQIMP